MVFCNLDYEAVVSISVLFILETESSAVPIVHKGKEEKKMLLCYMNTLYIKSTFIQVRSEGPHD